MAATDPEHLTMKAVDDPEVWRAFVAEGRLAEHEPGVILQAFWTARKMRDERLAADLFCHLSDVVLAQVAPKVKSYFLDGGRELVDEIHHKIMVAMLDPSSADGKGLVNHFGARVHLRFVDAVKRYRRGRQVELPALVDAAGRPVDEGDDAAATADFGSVEVANVLSLIKDERKRLAFAMTMANHPKGDIAAMLKIDPKTLYTWLAEVREFLKAELNL